jgi:hypothetical protein
MPATARQRRTPGRTHPLYQLDRRLAHGKPPRGFADRAALLDRAHDPQPRI